MCDPLMLYMGFGMNHPAGGMIINFKRVQKVDKKGRQIEHEPGPPSILGVCLNMLNLNF